LDSADRKPPSTFAAELTRWRTVHGLSKRALAQRPHVDPSYVSHLEASREQGSATLARNADTQLDAGEALWKTWQSASTAPPAPEAADAVPSSGLVVL